MSTHLISDEYRALQRAAHKDPAYGQASVAAAPLVAAALEQRGAQEILDYGAGKGRLGNELAALAPEVWVADYDPAIPGWDAPPAPCAFVACVDVLEHVEPDRLDAVLADLHRVTVGVLFVTIATGPSKRILADGRNAHLIQQPVEWWRVRLAKYFEVVEEYPGHNGLVALLTRRADDNS